MTPTLDRAQALVLAGNHPAALAVLDSGLAQLRLAAQQVFSLLEARINSLLALIEDDRAEADALAMLALARRSKRAAFEARALNALSLVQNRQERNSEAQQTAQQAQAAARRSRQPLLLGVALLREASACFVQRCDPLLRMDGRVPEAWDTE